MIEYLGDFDAELNHFNEVYPELNSNVQSLYYDLDQFKSSCISTSNDLSIFHVNVRSLYPKMDELLCLLSSLGHHFDVICITETWLTEELVDMVKIDKYRMFSLIRNGRRGGGISIFVHDRINNCELMRDFYQCQDNIESLVIECTVGPRKFAIGCIYRPPNTDYAIFMNFLELMLDELSGDLYSNAFLCGDFNVNILNCDTEPSSTDFLNVMSSNSFLPLITKPSRINDVSGCHSLIDNIFCKDPISYVSGLIVTALSDHYPVFSIHKNIFDFDADSPRSRNIRYRIINEASIHSLCTSLSVYDFSRIYEMDDVDEAFSQFETTVMHYYNICCPIVNRCLSYKDLTKPWIDIEAKKEIKLRDSFLKLYRSGRMRQETFNRVRNRVTKLIRDKKQQYFSSKFERIKGDIRRTWSLINDIVKPCNNCERGVISKLLVDGTEINNTLQIANVANEYFSNIGSNIANSISNPPNYRDFLAGNYPNSFFFPPTNTVEVTEYIRSLKNKKCSIHCLSPLVLKQLTYIIAPVLTFLINLSISKCMFPKCLKVARVVPLFKGGNRMQIAHYRPISVLNIFSKIIEKQAFKHLYKYLETNNVLTDCQFGFRYKRSTTEAIVQHCDYIYEALDENNICFSM